MEQTRTTTPGATTTTILADIAAMGGAEIESATPGL
jgi:hypothetical protein